MVRKWRNQRRPSARKKGIDSLQLVGPMSAVQPHADPWYVRQLRFCLQEKVPGLSQVSSKRYLPVLLRGQICSLPTLWDNVRFFRIGLGEDFPSPPVPGMRKNQARVLQLA
jgi:hypothetical protein